MFYDVVGTISGILGTIMTILMMYKIVIGVVGFFGKRKYKEAKQNHEYAILIAGRNEEKVVVLCQGI